MDEKQQIAFLKNVIKAKEEHLAVYKNLVEKCNTNRMLQLEADLKAEKKINGILTEELLKYENLHYQTQGR
jgi:hypothetical protein